MGIDYELGVPVYEQLASILREKIMSGEIPPGRALPSGKTLVQEYGVARGTVDKATALLKTEGLVYTLPGRGMFVSRSAAD